MISVRYYIHMYARDVTQIYVYSITTDGMLYPARLCSSYMHTVYIVFFGVYHTTKSNIVLERCVYDTASLILPTGGGVYIIHVRYGLKYLSLPGMP